jgi:hypothetical protein
VIDPDPAPRQTFFNVDVRFVQPSCQIRATRGAVACVITSHNVRVEWPSCPRSEACGRLLGVRGLGGVASIPGRSDPRIWEGDTDRAARPEASNFIFARLSLVAHIPPKGSSCARGSARNGFDLILGPHGDPKIYDKINRHHPHRTFRIAQLFQRQPFEIAPVQHQDIENQQKWDQGRKRI